MLRSLYTPRTLLFTCLVCIILASQQLIGLFVWENLFMNKVFKIIWNKTTQSFVVTSELAKGAVKALQTPNNV